MKRIMVGTLVLILSAASSYPGEKLTLQTLNKTQIVERLDELAQLYKVYQEWPTLYKTASINDNKNHFLKFAKHENWIVIVAQDQHNKIIGCLTGLPIDECDKRYKEAFPHKELPSKTYNIKDCLVSKNHRNQGVATSLYNELEMYLKSGQYENISIALTYRDESFHRPRPQDAVPTHQLWTKLGFQKVLPGRYYTSWTLVGEDQPFDNVKEFWIKHLI